MGPTGPKEGASFMIRPQHEFGFLRGSNRVPDGSLRNWIKLGLSTAVEATGLGAVGRAVRTHLWGARIFVLGYHRVVDHIDYDGPLNPSLCVTTDSFRRQMEQLRERFVVVPLSYVVRAVRGELELPQDAAAVTFDDGYRDVLLRAAPILRDLGIPAAVFVPTGFDRTDATRRLLPHDRMYAALWSARQAGLPLGRLGDGDTALLLARADRVLADEGPSAAVDELIRALPASALAQLTERLENELGPPALDDGAAVLQPDEVRALADGGWEIGGHTEGHVVLTHEPLEEVRRQLTGSKADLERWSGRPCRYFAYCNGYHSSSLVDELRRAGFEGAVTTCDRSNGIGPHGHGDPFRIARKVLWEAHARGPSGGFSPALSAAHLHDLFGALGLTKPVEGNVDTGAVRPSLLGVPPPSPRPGIAPEKPEDQGDQPNDRLPPTEVELAY
jgi:peptidoglycan/xylan/chitin deacetylase (PgdA/CDA1 family)